MNILQQTIEQASDLPEPQTTTITIVRHEILKMFRLTFEEYHVLSKIHYFKMESIGDVFMHSTNGKRRWHDGNDGNDGNGRQFPLCGF